MKFGNLLIASLVIFAACAASSSAQRRVHVYAGGGVSLNLVNTNFTQVRNPGYGFGRLAIGIDINRRIDPDRMELLLECDIQERAILFGGGFKLNFEKPGGDINYHLAGLIGLSSQNDYGPWFGAFAGLEFYRFAFLSIGFNHSSRSSVAYIPVAIGFRL